MGRRLYAKIGVENCAYSFDDLFTFTVPDDLSEQIQPGVLVIVPFGRGNHARRGFVFSMTDVFDAPDGAVPKEILSVADPRPMLNEEMLALALYLRERTFSTYFACAKTMLPGGLFRNGDVAGELRVKTLSLADPADVDVRIDFTPKQRAVVDFLAENEAASVKEIAYYTGVSESVIRSLLKKGVLTQIDQVVQRRPEAVRKETGRSAIELSPEQDIAYRSLLEKYRGNEFSVSLLFGVTGSGKTSVYLKLIDRIVEDGKSVIVLVPEISLTPQSIALFSGRYGDKVAVMHSALSVGERRDEYFRIKNGEATVVIGTRSAVFAPVERLGAVIVDEEQEHTYKSETSPRYDAKNVARFRCARHGALLLLASATPSVETYARAKAGKYGLYTLSHRFGGAVLPDVLTVDMTDRSNADPSFAVSEPLHAALAKNLSRGEQSILLVNRRGYNTFVVCKACKNVVSCPNCSISMTYHAANNRLMCHYCGYSIPFLETCPVCGDANIRYSGFGTQRVEQELRYRLPSARILRMDADTTTAKNSHARVLGSFADGEYDILIGTQMVAKGLDFPSVTLVGVLNADNELYGGDFRGSEKTFDLITQVVGRAGRGEKRGRAVIQTVSPDNQILSLAAKQDYEAFFASEISLRRAMVYPPFCDLCLVGFSGPDKEETVACAEAFFAILRRYSETQYPDSGIIILGPLSPRVSKINNVYRQKILIKCVNQATVRSMIDLSLKDINRNRDFRRVAVFAVMNPERTD